MDPPLLRAVAKTHKKTGQDGMPKSRPVCDGSQCYNAPLGDMLSDLISPIHKSNKEHKEVQSTEEMLAKIEETNEKLAEMGIKNGVLGSMDVEALFPSIDQEDSARIVAEEMIKHGVEYEGVDVRLATHYLGVCMTKERQVREGVSHLIPARKARDRRGRRLTVFTKSLSGPMKRVRKEKTSDEGEGEVGGEECPIGKNLDEAEGEEIGQGEEEEEAEQKW